MGLFGHELWRGRRVIAWWRAARRSAAWQGARGQGAFTRGMHVWRVLQGEKIRSPGLGEVIGGGATFKTGAQAVQG